MGARVQRGRGRGRVAAPRVPLPGGVRRYRGPAGGSAQAEYERLLSAHRSGRRRWSRRVLVRGLVGGVLAAGVVVVGLVEVSGFGGLTGVQWGVGLLVALGFGYLPVRSAVRTAREVPEEIDRWRRGAQGERATAVLLRGVEALGWPVLHDRSLPGTGANVDHLVVGPGGVFHLDSKHWSGALVWDGQQLWRGRLPYGASTSTADWESTRVIAALAPLLPEGWVVPVRTAVVVHGAVVPFGAVSALVPGGDGRVVSYVGADVLSGWLDQQQQLFTAPQRAMIAAQLEEATPPYVAAPG